MALTAKQNEGRAADLVKAILALESANFHLDHATQHARDARETDAVTAGFRADLAALRDEMKDAIVTAAETINFTPGEASAEAMTVQKFLAT